MVQHRVHFEFFAEERLSHHPRYGDSDLQQPALNGKVFFAGTETARQHGGASIYSGMERKGSCEAMIWSYLGGLNPYDEHLSAFQHYMWKCTVLFLCRCLLKPFSTPLFLKWGCWKLKVGCFISWTWAESTSQVATDAHGEMVKGWMVFGEMQKGIIFGFEDSWSHEHRLTTESDSVDWNQKTSKSIPIWHPALRLFSRSDLQWHGSLREDSERCGKAEVGKPVRYFSTS